MEPALPTEAQRRRSREGCCQPQPPLLLLLPHHHPPQRLQRQPPLCSPLAKARQKTKAPPASRLTSVRRWTARCSPPWGPKRLPPASPSPPPPTRPPCSELLELLHRCPSAGRSQRTLSLQVHRQHVLFFGQCHRKQKEGNKPADNLRINQSRVYQRKKSNSAHSKSINFLLSVP